MTSGGGMAALHAGLVERARNPRSSDSQSSPAPGTPAVGEGRSDELTRAPSTRAVELTPMRQVEPVRPYTPPPVVEEPTVPEPVLRETPVDRPAPSEEVNDNSAAVPDAAPAAPEPIPYRPLKRVNTGRTDPLRYAVNRKGNLVQKRRFGRRRSLTLRVEDKLYKRLLSARQDMGRTSQDILETALVLYLNLLGVEETPDP